jgi:hypothetical protein
VESGQKRRRWDSTESVVAADSSLAVPTPPVAAASASVGDGLSKAGISSHPKDYEEQLRQQKEIQFLEARIRGMKVRLAQRFSWAFAALSLLWAVVLAIVG